MTLRATTHLFGGAFQTIGQTIMRFSYLEWLTGRAVGQVLHLSPAEGRIITERMQIRGKLETLALVAIEHGWPPEALSEFADVRAAIESAQEGRNDLAHCIYATDDSHAPYTVKYRGGKGDKNRLEGQAVDLTPDRLKNISEDVEHAVALLDAWVDHHLAQLVALREIS